MNVILYILCLVCAVALFVTAVARLNDLQLKHSRRARDWVRGGGMVGVGLGALLIVVGPAYGHALPDIELTLLVLGMTLSWLTTPNQPPWWSYITKGEEAKYGRREGDSHAQP